MTSRTLAAEEALWRRTLARVRQELAGLPPAERAWLAKHGAAIGELQGRLHALFLAAGGEARCAACDGACCGCGRNHLTLANLLALLPAEAGPPAPDFSAPCPWLGAEGCRLAPPERPFNCVTFICESIEERLGTAGCREFYRLEQELRGLYQELARRLAGAGLQGLLLRAESLGGKGFFDRPRSGSC